MLALPIVLGAGLAGLRSPGAWAVAAAAVRTFLAHPAIAPLLRRRLETRPVPAGWSRPRAVWASCYTVGALAAFVSAVALAPASHRGWLLGLAALSAVGGAVYTGASALGRGRATALELIGMAVLSSSAPLMALAAGEPVDSRLLAVAAPAFAYSASALAYVRAYRRLDTARPAAAAGCIGAHVALFGGLLLLASGDWLSPWLLVAFVPVIVRTAWGLLRPPQDLRQLGLRELWVAASYTAIATVLIAVG